ncbi:Ribosome production factor 1 [Sorochytrium milnesiophthora]
MIELNDIRNKRKREDVYHHRKQQKMLDKVEVKKLRKREEEADPTLKEERLKNNVPNTIENTREYDETTVQEDEEVFADEDTDEFAGFFRNGITPKICVTTSRQPKAPVYEFAHEFVSIFPTAEFHKRGNFEIKQIVEFCKNREYTDLVIINEDRKVPNAITMIHLPDGPTAYFKLTSIKHSKDIEGHGRTSAHKPELILNNFNTRLGHSIGRFFASLFPPCPEFEGRQVVTFHNQRDFIFIRRHRYVFENRKKVELQELGPRFTLKLKWLQKGTFDTKNGDYEWMFTQKMETSRRKFFL